MADTAAHLVDRVFPEVPVRQWALTLPVGLRYRMAFDVGLTAEVHRAFIRTLFPRSGAGHASTAKSATPMPEPLSSCSALATG
jgi:hypothetical protein